MEQRKLDPLKEMKLVLVSLLTRIDNHRQKCVTTGQPFGVCTVNPKKASIGRPSKEVQKELERRATEHFQSTSAWSFCLRYWTPPILPVLKDDGTSPTADDYHMVFEFPQFDAVWETTTLARGILYCPSDGEEGDWSDWFELQHEAIRLTPLLHQSLEEYKIIYLIDTYLEQDGLSEFENFIYEYGRKDPHFPMQKSALENWEERNIDWRVRYRLLKHLFDSSSTLRDFYATAREKATSSRNQMLKDLLWAFVQSVEEQLILNTKLTEKLKKEQLAKIRASKKRIINKEKYHAKQPAVCISDIECGQLLYLLIETLLSSTGENVILMESILFIWIAQHGAFSDLNLNIQDIRSIKTSAIQTQDLTIQTSKGDIFITSGLRDILTAWVKIHGRKKSDQLFQKLSGDNLEDLLSRYTTQLFGLNGRLLPKDFLEKVHTTHGARIPLDLRREILQQETLIKLSPYRIKSQEIKNQIQKSFKKTSSESFSS